MFLSKKSDSSKINKKIAEIASKIIFIIIVAVGSYVIIDDIKYLINITSPREISKERISEFKSLVTEFNEKVYLIENMETDIYTKEELKVLKENFKELKKEINSLKLNNIDGGYYNNAKYFKIMYEDSNLLGNGRITYSSFKVIDVITKYLKYPELEKSIVRTGRIIMALNGSFYNERDSINIIYRGGNRNFSLFERYNYSNNDSTLVKQNVDMMKYYIGLVDLTLEIGGVIND